MNTPSPASVPSQPRTIEDLIEASLTQAATSTFGQKQCEQMSKRLTQLVIARAGSEPLTQITQTICSALNVSEETMNRALKLAQTGNVPLVRTLITDEILLNQNKQASAHELEEGSVSALLTLASSAGRCLSALIDDREAAASYAKKLFALSSAGNVDPGRVLAISRDLDDLAKAQRLIRAKMEENSANVKQTLADVIGQAADAASVIEVSTTKMERQASLAAYEGNVDAMKLALGKIVVEANNTVDQMRETKVSLAEKEARIVGAQTEIATLKKQLQEMSRMVQEDPLTGALNRRGLESAAQYQIEQSHRLGSFCLGLIDLDNFKSFNDTFGHAAGDEALKHFSKCARSQLRKGDLLSRMGGEEFIILFPATQINVAYTILERIAREVAKPFLGCGQIGAPDSVLLTFSSGLAQLKEDETVEQIIARADTLMYLAKSTGKAKCITE